MKNRVIEAEIAVHDGRLFVGGKCPGNHSIKRSIASILSVADARYC